MRESGYKFAKAKEKRKIVSLFLFVSIRRRHRVLGVRPLKSLVVCVRQMTCLLLLKNRGKRGVREQTMKIKSGQEKDRI